MVKKLQYIDLFAGCGGLSLGLHNAGCKGVFAIEKSDMAFETLKHNLIDKIQHFDWPEWLPQKNYDINYFIQKYSKNLKAMSGNVDLIVGGPPCQGFSMAGRRNESDERNDLVKSYIKFIKLVNPKAILFENVKGFTIGFKKRGKRGKPYSEFVLEELEKLGYSVEGKIVNFSNYGVPQKRERFILFGIKSEVKVDFFQQLSLNAKNFLKSKGLHISKKTSIEDALSDLLKNNGVVDSPDKKGFKAGVYSTIESNYQKLMRKKQKLSNPDSHRFPNHADPTISKFSYILKSSKKNKNVNQHIREKYNIKKHCIIPLDGEDCSPTLTTLPDDYIHYQEPRILTVREYARIQSFPDWFEFKGKYTSGGKLRKIEVPRYTQIGNAIPPLFAEIAGSTLIELLNEESK